MRMGPDMPSTVDQKKVGLSREAHSMYRIGFRKNVGYPSIAELTLAQTSVMRGRKAAYGLFRQWSGRVVGKLET